MEDFDFEVASFVPYALDQILIVGAGMAGSLLAFVLSRAGYGVTVFDPHRRPPPMFRNEKLGDEQIVLLRRYDALSCFADVCWPPEGHPHAYPADARPSLTDCGAPHHAWLTSVRDAWPANVRFVEAAVDSIATSDDMQVVTTATGERFAGRLVVVATGRAPRLLDELGLRRRAISPGHSVCLGFSVALDSSPSVVVQGLPGAGIGYVSIFPMPGETRVNVFSYRPLDDPWTRRMSRSPLEALAEVSPDAAEILAGARVVRRCEARGTDLYRVDQPARDGVVLIGDAFHAPCPASGTGMLRILNDIDVLARTHIPQWLGSEGMARTKIARFYADPAKRRIDRRSLSISLRARGSKVGRGPYWALHRTAVGVRCALRTAIAAAPVRRAAVSRPQPGV